MINETQWLHFSEQEYQKTWNINEQELLIWGGPVNICKHLLAKTTRSLKDPKTTFFCALTSSN